MDWSEVISMSNKISSLWATLSVPQRSKILVAWKDTFVMFCVAFLIGGNIVCHIYELSDFISLVFTVVGISNGALAEALDIWGEVLIYWDEDKKKDNRIGRGDWM